MLIARITDTHITKPGQLLMGIVDTAAALERAVSALNDLIPAPGAAVLTGDLVESGEPEEYAHLRALLAPLQMPVFAIPGNHDAREPMREAFIGDGYIPAQGFLNYVIEDYPLRLIALDTLIPGEGGGVLCSDRLHWIEAILARSSEFSAVISIARSTAALPAQSPGRRQARRISSFSISAPRRGSAWRSSHPATSFTTGARASVSLPTPQRSETGPARISIPKSP